MVRVTGNFSSEAPLSEVVTSTILAALEAGWGDPKKISQAATRAKILETQARELIAEKLNIRVDEIEVVGESELLPFLSIAGFLHPDRSLAIGAIDRGKIRALARWHQPSAIIPVSASGHMDPTKIDPTSLLSLQVGNGETGIVQDLPRLSKIAELVVLDATTSGSRVALGDRWDGAIFDSQSWNGPSGIGIMAIRNSAQWTYPLPHIAPIRTPGSYSLPLLLASSVALENFFENTSHLSSLNVHIRNRIAQELPGAKAVGDQSSSLAHLLTLVIPDVVNEMIVRELEALGISIDAGSACAPGDLAPSHVLDAMGIATTGSLRLTLRNEHTLAEVDQMINAIVQTVTQG